MVMLVPVLVMMVRRRRRRQLRRHRRLRRMRRRRYASRVQRRTGGRAARFALVVQRRGRTVASGRRPGARAHDGLDGETDFGLDDHRRGGHLDHCITYGGRTTRMNRERERIPGRLRDDTFGRDAAHDGMSPGGTTANGATTAYEGGVY